MGARPPRWTGRGCKVDWSWVQWWTGGGGLGLAVAGAVGGRGGRWGHGGFAGSVWGLGLVDGFEL